MKKNCAVIVFAKAPIPGYAKMRLASVLGEEKAASLAARMLDEMMLQAVAADVGPVELCCTPDESHPAFLFAVKRYGVALGNQGEGDLGERMQRAVDRALVQYPRVLIVGTDAPQLDVAFLRAAAQALESHSAVFIPAYDGGYVLVGASRSIPEVFRSIAWSTADVMAQTRQRLAEANIDYIELPALHDIDLPKDLIHVPGKWLK